MYICMYLCFYVYVNTQYVYRKMQKHICICTYTCMFISMYMLLHRHTRTHRTYLKCLMHKEGHKISPPPPGLPWEAVGD